MPIDTHIENAPTTETTQEASQKWSDYLRVRGETFETISNERKRSIRDLIMAKRPPSDVPEKWEIDNIRAEKQAEDPKAEKILRQPSSIDHYMMAWADKAKEMGEDFGDNAPVEVDMRILENRGLWRNEFGWTESDINELENLIDALGTKFEYMRFDKNIKAQFLGLLLASGVSLDIIKKRLDMRAFTAREAAAERRLPEDAKTINNLLLTMFGDLRSPEERNSDASTNTEMGSFKFKNEYLQKYIFPETFNGQRASWYQMLPDSVEDFAWQISYNDSENFGMGGAFPMMRLKVFKEDGTGSMRDGNRHGEYFVDPSSMVRWLRERIYWLYDLNQDAAIDFFSNVKLRKMYSQISLIEIFEDFTRYFKSKIKVKKEDGSEASPTYQRVFDEWVVEAFATGEMRKFDVTYRQAPMGEMGPLNDAIKKLYYENIFTRELYQSNLFDFMLTAPMDFKMREKNKALIQDNLMGSIFTDIFLSFDSLSDFKSLVDIWGSDSMMFTKRGMLQAIGTSKGYNIEMTGQMDPINTLGYDMRQHFDKMYDANGRITTAENVKHFIKFINFFEPVRPDNKNEKIVRFLLRIAASQKYGEKQVKDGKAVVDALGTPVYGIKADTGAYEDWTRDIAEVWAFSWARPSGSAARNGLASGYDQFDRLQHTQMYRSKMATATRGDYFGNPLTVHQFKMMGVDFMRGSNTTYDAQNEKGKMRRKMTPMEVMQYLSAERNKYLNIINKEKEARDAARKAGNNDEADRIQSKIDNYWSNMNREWQNMAGQMEFERDAMRKFSEDHFERGYKLYDVVMHGKYLNLDKFTTYDPFRGVTFNREQFAEEVQSKIFKQARYFMLSYGGLNFNMKFRTLNQTESNRLHTPIYEEMPLGQAMFGYEMVNRQEFWKVENGRYKKDPATGKHEIDWDLVQGGKGLELLWRQWVSMQIAAELRAHRARYTSDPSYNMSYYLNVIEALTQVAGDITGDEFDIRSVRTPRNSFFRKEDIAWIRRTAGINPFRLYTSAFFQDLFYKKQGEQGAIAQIIGLAVKHAAILGSSQ